MPGNVSQLLRARLRRPAAVRVKIRPFAPSSRSRHAEDGDLRRALAADRTACAVSRASERFDMRVLSGQPGGRRRLPRSGSARRMTLTNRGARIVRSGRCEMLRICNDRPEPAGHIRTSVGRCVPCRARSVAGQEPCNDSLQRSTSRKGGARRFGSLKAEDPARGEVNPDSPVNQKHAIRAASPSIGYPQAIASRGRAIHGSPLALFRRTGVPVRVRATTEGRGYRYDKPARRDDTCRAGGVQAALDRASRQVADATECAGHYADAAPLAPAHAGSRWRRQR